MKTFLPVSRRLLAPVALTLLLSALPLQAVDDNGKYVTGLFIALLNRDPDALGWLYWKGLLERPNNPVSRDQLTSDFLGTPEYTGGQCLAGNANANFLACLYRIGLNREPIPSEITMWQSTSHVTVTEQIILGTEFQTLRASRLLYQTAYVTIGGLQPQDSSGLPNVEQRFMMHYLDTDGPDLVWFGRILFNSNPAGPDGNGSCPLVWNTGGQLIIEGPYPDPVIYGSFGAASPVLSNTNCWVDSARSQLTRTQGGWDVTVFVKFLPAFSSRTAAHRIYGQGGNKEGLVPPWTDAGSWMDTVTQPNGGTATVRKEYIRLGGRVIAIENH